MSDPKSTTYNYIPTAISYNEREALVAVYTVLNDPDTYGVALDWSPAEIMAFCQIESSFNPRAYRREPRINDASYGLMQTLLGTVRPFGFNGDASELFVPVTSVQYGIKVLDHFYDYLQLHLGRDPTDDELSGSYNAGPGAVVSHVRNWIAQQGRQGETTDGTDAPVFDEAYTIKYADAVARWQGLLGVTDK
jgi:soluble lytic murein transglycosylase-like protein